MQLFGQYSKWRLQLVILIVSVSSSMSWECYICSGSFPQRDCELWPDIVPHGPIKQECATRYCTTYVRYRPMQHLLIPLGPNKAKATAAPLRPVDFEVESISRDCVDRVDQTRNNRCLPDGDGLGATCFTSCQQELCNKGLRKPNMTELYGKSPPPPVPSGPNEHDRWTPPTVRTTTTTKQTTTTTKSYVEEEKNTKDKDFDDDKMDKEGKRGKGGKGGKRGGMGSRENFPGFGDVEPNAGSTEMQAQGFLVISLLFLSFHQCFLHP